MEYFIKGSAHFFNLFADFLEHCENIIYLIFLVILLILICVSYTKVKSSIKAIFKSYFHLFKYIVFVLGFSLLLISSILTYKMNNQFKILSLLVTTINFIKETFKIYDNNILNADNKWIFNFKDFRNIFIPNFVLIFFKITYWAEIYIFDFNEIKKYFMIMFLVIIVQMLYMVIFKIYSIYSKVFQFLKAKNDYNILNKLYDMFWILIISRNETNYFRIVKLYLQREIITKENRKEILNFCYYYKAISNKFRGASFDIYNSKIYNDFKSVSNRLESGKDD